MLKETTEGAIGAAVARLFSTYYYVYEFSLIELELELELEQDNQEIEIGQPVVQMA